MDNVFYVKLVCPREGSSLFHDVPYSRTKTTHIFEMRSMDKDESWFEEVVEIITRSNATEVEIYDNGMLTYEHLKKLFENGIIEVFQLQIMVGTQLKDVNEIVRTLCNSENNTIETLDFTIFKNIDMDFDDVKDIPLDKSLLGQLWKQTEVSMFSINGDVVMFNGNYHSE